MRRILLLVTMFMVFFVPNPGYTQDASKAEYVMKMGTIVPRISTWGQEVLKMGDRISKETNGRVRYISYLGGVLGDEADNARKMRLGQVQVAAVTLSSLNTVVRELAVLDLPFLYKSRDEAVYIYYKYFDTFNEQAKKKGVVLPNIVEVGWWDFYTNKKVTRLEDLQKMRIEAIVSPVFSETFKAWDIPMLTYPPADHVANMERGVADGATEPLQYHMAGQLFTVGPHCYKTHWFYQICSLGMNKAYLDKMPKDLRDIVLKIHWELGVDCSRATRKGDDGLWPILTNETYKMTVTEPSPTELKKFKDRSRPVWDTLIEKGYFSRSLLDQIVADLEEYRRKGSPPLDYEKIRRNMPKSLAEYTP